MCSSGGPMADLSMKKLKTKKYKCLDLGKKVICPSCQSENVEAQE